MNEIGPDFVAHPRREVVTAEIDGEAVIYDELLGATHLLNATGAVVWELLDGETRLEELSAGLAEAYGVGVGNVLADVVRLVRELGERGLLEDVTAEDSKGETEVDDLRPPPV